MVAPMNKRSDVERKKIKPRLMNHFNMIAGIIVSNLGCLENVMP